MNRSVCVIHKLFNLSYRSKRSFCELPQGIQYPGFTYYPRDENFQDPPYEPSKLFLVRRIKPFRGRNREEKKSLELLNIDGDKKTNGHVTVVKNTPGCNALLWKVKHLVDIKPITVKGELPKDGDYSGTFLRETGELIVSPKLKVNPQQIEASEKYLKTNTKLKRMYLRDYLKKKWLQGFSSYE